ncbi:carboxylate--amine ligase [Halorubellus salinus]|uniref:carboxylate--amine ligase n=1 Tax=Halorubellus salinus TaxID=755309 RepID=UPI001D089A03|nr:ATP-grasp domain-containing protein [Halorubellus salinus]
MRRSKYGTEGSRGHDAVVVPADPGGSSLACMRSLGRRGVRVLGTATSESAPALASRYCDETHVLPDPSRDLEAYAAGLLSLTRRADVRTVVPLSEVDAYVLAINREAFATHVGAPWPDADGMRAAQDRLELFERAADAGVRTPETAPLGAFDARADRYIVKPRHTVVVVDGGARTGTASVHEAGVEPDVAAFVDAMGHEPIAQEYVPSAGEFGFFALYDHGTPVATFQHRRVRSYTYAGGASVYRESIADDALADAGRRVLDALDWHGPAMVEFRKDARDGEYVLLEVNPRFWGSLPLAVAAGVDFPAAYWALSMGRDVADAALDGGSNDAAEGDGERLAGERSRSGEGSAATDGGRPGVDAGAAARPAYDVGLGCHRLLGECSYLLSVRERTFEHVERPSLAREVVAVARSLVAQPNFDVLSLHDPKPFLATLVSDWRRLRDR